MTASTLIEVGLSEDPIVQAALADPLEREFEDGDEYVYCYDGNPVRLLTVTRTFRGVHPERSSYSFVWLPTLEQSTYEILVKRGLVVTFDQLEDDTFMASTGRSSATAGSLRAAAYSLLIAVRG